MIKKIFILTLLLILLVTTTGMPFSVRFCKILNTNANSLCKMQNDENKSENKCSGCCKDKTGSKNETIKNHDFCKLATANINITDSFILIKTDVQNNLEYSVSIHYDVSNIFSLLKISHSISSNISPPQLQNNHLYLSNSVLLI